MQKAKTAEMDKGSIALEIEKRRHVSEKKKQEQLERIKQGSQKKITKQGPNWALIGMGLVILIAIAVIVAYVLSTR